MSQNKPLKIFRSSAGSGKTYTLVKEYISILLNSKDPLLFKRILAITFTNKAANEMKERVLETLKKLSTGESTDLLDDYLKIVPLSPEKLAQRSHTIFQHIIHHYGEFNVLTIDKFIHRIIRSFTRELGLAMNFELESDVNLFISRSIELLLEEVGNDKDLTQYLIQFSEQLIENSEKGNVEKELKDLSQILMKDDGKTALEELSEFQLSHFISIQDEIKNKIKSLSKEIKSLCLATINLIEQQGISIFDLAGGKRSGFGKYYTSFANNLNIDLVITPAALKNLSDDVWYSKSAKPHIKNAIDSIHSELVQNTTQIVKLFNEYKTQSLFNKNFIGFSLLNSLHKVLKTIKEESNIVFLNDFNEIISTVILNEPAPFIYEKIGNRYRYFLIDEFQDTSKLQWNNLIPLVYDSLANGNKNLIVGDAKQAIYRWRGGDVNQFIHLPRIAGAFRDLAHINRTFESSGAIDQLKNNYRSYQTIVHFNNWLFKNMADLSESEAIKSIYEGIAQDVIKKETGLVSYQILHGGKEEIQPEKIALTLQYIQECLEDGFTYNDIAILVKTNKDGKLIADHLTELNIPVVSSDSVVLASSEEVQFILSFLTTTVNTANEQAILKCLQFLKQEQHLSVIHEQWRVPSEKNESYSQAIDFDGFIKNGYPHYNRSYFNQLNLYDKVIYLLETFQLNRFDPYIDQLLNTIQGYLKRNTSILQDFINYYEEHKNKIAVNSGGNNNAIQISTIHKSKGLQYPVVIIPFADWVDKNNQFKNYTWINPDHIVDYQIPKYIAPINKNTLNHYQLDSVYEKEQAEIVLDNLNLFYVAFTRPEKRMYIISSIGNRASNHVFDKINKLVTNHSAYNPEENHLILGERNKIEDQKIEKPNSPSQGAHVKTWRQHLGLSLDRNALELELSELNEREYGNAVHYIWANILSPDDCSPAIEKAIINGVLPAELRAEVLEDFKACFALPQVQQWYNIPNAEVLNETAIVAETGQSYRPDKIILTSQKKAIVIDYKTGQQRKSHQKQLREYGQLLKELGYSPTLNLLYMKEKEVVVC
ncbi:MAG: UvrD-helicase domain-containing protein [Flavobacteriales bacterium]|jgi:ATP-dependent exoDNAse (exonuclease V) beta subunit|nr:UvrD-helicase domain-containing protein [Flavobacteriales bacterium]